MSAGPPARMPAAPPAAAATAMRAMISAPNSGSAGSAWQETISPPRRRVSTLVMAAVYGLRGGFVSEPPRQV